MIADKLAQLVADAPDARMIVLDPRSLGALKKEIGMSVLYFGGAWEGHEMFLGLPIVRHMPGAFCRNCGAPVEPNVCGYCKTPSEVIEVRT